MKILKPATHNPFKKTCGRCGCVFIYANCDVAASDLDEGSSYNYVRCPECGMSILADRHLDTPDFRKKEEHFDV